MFEGQYGWRSEQSYKQTKGALGWADFQVRSDRAIRRHWQLVCCAFSFCWWAYLRRTGIGREDERRDEVLATGPGASFPPSGTRRRGPGGAGATTAVVAAGA